ncbi:phosphate ABC transporter substrate-binding protein [Oribacterium sp. HCP28S3_H8]|jgi:hypothetical protein|uniref:phosphate ABC transporter substrate-binding protein n=1 Tax=Oribacterium sp. HCP28S3_H8 TaxID=3438945 RepID=UPI003069BA2E|nr:phosphate ABC transporter substrate-binding protein [Oribacterium sp.]
MNLKRLLARIALAFILVLLVLLLYSAFTGRTQMLLALLFCLIVVPVLIYVFIWFTDLMRRK